MFFPYALSEAGSPEISTKNKIFFHFCVKTQQSCTVLRNRVKNILKAQRDMRLTHIF